MKHNQWPTATSFFANGGVKRFATQSTAPFSRSGRLTSMRLSFRNPMIQNPDHTHESFPNMDKPLCFSVLTFRSCIVRGERVFRSHARAGLQQRNPQHMRTMQSSARGENVIGQAPDGSLTRSCILSCVAASAATLKTCIPRRALPIPYCSMIEP